MLKRLLFCCTLLLFFTNGWADKYEATLKDFKAATGTENIFSEAYGFAVFPTIGKGGIGIGGAYGKGRVYRASSYVGDTSVAQLSVGFQLGGQAYSQIIFFQDETAYKRFTNGSFEFGAEASAIALTAGAHAKAGTTGVSVGGNESSSGNASVSGDWVAGMMVFTLAKGGLMYEASIGGQKYNYRPLPLTN